MANKLGEKTKKNDERWKENKKHEKINGKIKTIKEYIY